MAQTDWSFLNDGLDIATVDRGVTAGIARPPGGGSFIYAFNSLAAVRGAVALFANLVDFAPMAKGGSIRGCIQRGPSGGPTGFSPFFFLCCQGNSVNDTAYLLGLSDDDPHRIVLRKGMVAAGTPASEGANVLLASGESFTPGKPRSSMLSRRDQESVRSIKTASLREMISGGTSSLSICPRNLAAADGETMPRNTAAKTLLAVITGGITMVSGVQFYQHRHNQLPIVAGPGVTRVADLSKYGAGLKGTMADTKVFFLEGKEPGGKALVMANTHANEPDGILAALIFVENAVVEKGTLIVIPQFNNSASRNTRPGDGYPLFYEIPTAWGTKKFRVGDRGASPLDQWPDPDVYVHYPDRQLLSFLDARNTNRTWPGRPNGPLMERVTDAVDAEARAGGYRHRCSRRGNYVPDDQLHCGAGKIHCASLRWPR